MTILFVLSIIIVCCLLKNSFSESDDTMAEDNGLSEAGNGEKK